MAAGNADLVQSLKWEQKYCQLAVKTRMVAHQLFWPNKLSIIKIKPFSNMIVLYLHHCRCLTEPPQC